MTTNDPTPSLMDRYAWTVGETTGDCRRASALMLHHLLDDATGVEALLLEAREAGRVIPLVLALMDQTTVLAPGLDTDEGRAVLRRGVARLAALEQT